MQKKYLAYYFVIILALVHIQFNVHSFGLFLLVSALTALLPLPQMRWWKYSVLQLIALAFCLALKFPDTQVSETLGEILKTGGPAIIALTVLVSTITYTLVAWTVYQWVTLFVFEKRLRQS